MIRTFCIRLFGLAAVVGFEVGFGLTKWRPFEPPQPSDKRGIESFPGSVTFISSSGAGYVSAPRIIIMGPPT